jgi:hypothetical protein
MALPAALLSSVPNTVRSRGGVYFATGAVTSIDLDNGIISATVQGTDLYDVWIEPQASLLRATCTCPYFLDQLLICKHIWAVVLAADSRRWLPFTHNDPAADIDPVDIDDTGIPEPRTTHLPPRPSSTRPPAPPRPSPSAWRRQLGVVAASTLPPAPAAFTRPIPESLLFVLDLAASLAANAIVVTLMGREQKRNGDWRPPRPTRVSASAVRTLPPGDDRQILERILGGRPYYDWNPIYPDAGEIGQQRLDGALARDLLPAMCATGRCLLLIKEPSGPT